MSDESADNNADIVNRATDALRDTSIPNGPPDLLVASTIEAMGFETERAGSPKSKRRIAMIQISKVAIAACLLMAAGVAGWLATFGSNSHLVFADVLEVIEPIRNAQWKVSSEVNGKSYTYEGAATRDGLIRFTMPGEGWSVIDTVLAKMLVVDSTKKEATLTDDDRPAQIRPGNILAQLSELPEEGAEEIGQRKIDGRDTIGFRVRRYNVTTTIWHSPLFVVTVRVALPLTQAVQCTGGGDPAEQRRVIRDLLAARNGEGRNKRFLEAICRVRLVP